MTFNLIEELTTGPLANEIAGFLASGNDSKIFEILNRKDIDSYGWIRSDDLNTWCALFNQEYINIENIASDTNNPFYSAAKALLRRLDGAVAEQAINLGSPEVFYLIDNWPFVDQTGAAKQALISKGLKKISRLEQLGISITENDIATARLGV